VKPEVFTTGAAMAQW